ncbi:MAG TPA: substrate-binding domain-containing protein, partial [Usitatibacter sp.]|nr:substrate-binding domain-containing protein [Usitatibacter sp.]
EQVRAERGAYDAAIAYSDAQLGVLLEQLRRRGLLDNTIVVLAADHGEEFGEHGVFTHGNSVYFSALHVPFVVVDPRERARGVRVPEDLWLVGYDDIELASWGAYDLTTVRQPMQQMVAEAIGLLLAKIADHDKPLERRCLPNELVIRRSTNRQPFPEHPAHRARR